MSKDTTSDVPPPLSTPMVMPTLGGQGVSIAKGDDVGARGDVNRRSQRRRHRGWSPDTFVLDQCLSACCTGIVGFFEALCSLSCGDCCGNGDCC